jgi:hypothetical protein
MIGSDELNESPPKPSTMVFMADECKEGHRDQLPVDSQLALAQVRPANSSGHINNGGDTIYQQNGALISPRRKHMVAAMIHTEMKQKWILIRRIDMLFLRVWVKRGIGVRIYRLQIIANATNIIFHRRVAWSRYWPVNLCQNLLPLDHLRLLESTQLMVAEWEDPLSLV